MTRRLAASVALVVFAVCLASGAGAGNSFGTTVARALLAMGGTLVIGLVVGRMGQAMLDENLRAEEEKLKNSEANPGPTDR
jgi:NhaP-type Na+/H+ or K+/H+ antiporter